MTDKELEIVREQLKTAIEFMENTPDDGKPHHDALWWAGKMPAQPEWYEPRHWQETNWPITAIWEIYLTELRCSGLDGYAGQAKQLEIADLLATS